MNNFLQRLRDGHPEHRLSAPVHGRGHPAESDFPSGAGRTPFPGQSAQTASGTGQGAAGARRRAPDLIVALDRTQHAHLGSAPQETRRHGNSWLFHFYRFFFKFNYFQIKCTSCDTITPEMRVQLSHRNVIDSDDDDDEGDIDSDTVGSVSTIITLHYTEYDPFPRP